MRSIVVGTAGHIDHGKSALVAALTGTDPDRLKEEKARGITIDLGFAHTTIGGINFAFVDVPCHERFVKNMLAGVGGIDVVVLVVAADESVMPQTREHFAICRLLEVPAGLVALTKADLVDADTLELVALEIRDLTAGSFLADAPIVPVSARTGAGLDRLRIDLVSVASRTSGRLSDGVARLPIDRVFSMKGFGTIVTGTLVSGRVRVEDELAILPGGRTVKVRGVQVHGERHEEASAGQRTALNLLGVDVDDLARGQTLVSPGAFNETRLADALIQVLPEARPLKPGARVRFHHGTAEILARISPIGATAEGASFAPGSQRYVRLRFERPAVLVRGDRFILRAYSPPMTIAGGLILDPQPPRLAIRTEFALARCRELDPQPDVRPAVSLSLAAARLVRDAGTSGLPISSLVSRLGVAPHEVSSQVDSLIGQEAAVRVGERLVEPSVLERLERSVLAAVAEHHRQQPLSEGMSREEARERLCGHGVPDVFERVLDDLSAAGRVTGRERLALTSHRVTLSPAEERARQSIAERYRNAGLTPPDAAAVAETLGETPAVVDRVLKLLQRQKVLVRVEGLLFHEEALGHLKEEVTALKADGSGPAKLDVALFKEKFGVTRKFAIPLLEYLDRERITRRVGDARVVI